MKHNRFQLKIEKLEKQLADKERHLQSALTIIQQITKLPDSTVLQMVQEYGLTPEQLKIQQGNSNAEKIKSSTTTNVKS